MEWSSILDLKTQLKAQRSLLHEHLMVSTRFRSAGAVAGIGAVPSARLAIGAIPTGHPHQFRLALRPLDSSPATLGLVGVAQALAPHETEVVEIGAVRAVRPTGGRSNYAEKSRPLRPGYSLGQGAATGTLGGFVKQNGRDFMLSNHHVLVPDTPAPSPVTILQPGPGDGGRTPRDMVGELAFGVPFSNTGTNLCDVALATLARGISGQPCYPRPVVGVLNGLPPVNTRVWKVGRTTGFTWGIVTATSMDEIPINYGNGVTRVFDDQIEIDGLEGPFSQGGDSGSLIVTENGEAVALLFSGSDYGGRRGGGRTFGTPLNVVLGILKASLIC